MIVGEKMNVKNCETMVNDLLNEIEVKVKLEKNEIQEFSSKKKNDKEDINEVKIEVKEETKALEKEEEIELLD